MQKFGIIIAITIITSALGAGSILYMTRDNTEPKQAISTTTIQDGELSGVSVSLQGQTLSAKDLAALTGMHTQQVILGIHREDLALERMRIKESRKLWERIGLTAIIGIIVTITAGVRKRGQM